MRNLGAILVATLLASAVAAVPVWAQDPPHWSSASQSVDCTSNCHISHQSLGGGLNPKTGNFNLCESCHSLGALPIPANAAADTTLNTGTSHAFDVNASSGKFGTTLPTDSEQLLRIQEGNLVCSTCHNQHRSEAAYGGRSRVGDPDKINPITGTGILGSGGDFNGAVGLFYLIEITVDGDMPGTPARFGYSKDNGTSWFGCDPAACVTGGEPECASCFTTDAPPSPDGVTFSFGDGTYDDGEQWELYAAWPFLRRSMPLNHPADELVDAGNITTGDKFCRDCHSAWVMTHDADLVGGGGVQSYDGNPKSHPVGVGLNANAQGYDRVSPLDGDGSGSDANPSNDLKLDQFGNVQCLTCHGVHYADGNTLTDGP